MLEKDAQRPRGGEEPGARLSRLSQASRRSNGSLHFDALLGP